MQTKNLSVGIRPISRGFLVETSWESASRQGESGKDDYHVETQFASTLAKALKIAKAFLTIEDGNVIPF